MTTRIYLVTDIANPSEKPRLIDASSDSAAIRHAAKARYSARPAKPRDVADAMGKGAAIETTGVDVAQQTFDAIVGNPE